MPPTQSLEGLEAAKEIRAKCPSVAILLLSAHLEVETASELLKDGDRVGYLLKDASATATTSPMPSRGSSTGAA